jgi:hypothetical protein
LSGAYCSAAGQQVLLLAAVADSWALRLTQTALCTHAAEAEASFQVAESGVEEYKD